MTDGEDTQDTRPIPPIPWRQILAAVPIMGWLGGASLILGLYYLLSPGLRFERTGQELEIVQALALGVSLSIIGAIFITAQWFGRRP